MPTDTPPAFETMTLTHDGRLLTITLNRPEQLNAVDRRMHEELAEVFVYAAADPASDVVVLTGAGRAFSAGGDLDHIANNAANPHLFDEEARLAKKIVYAMLDLEKPLIGKVNGHAVGLGATLALLCDVVFAAENAKIGDPHVGVGLTAGDGGALIWPQRIGLTLAKEFLLTGELLTAKRAQELGLVNHCLPAGELDAAVDTFAKKMLAGAMGAIKSTKILLNMELKRIAHSVLEAGIDFEAETVRSADHREAVAALKEKRPPKFGG